MHLFSWKSFGRDASLSQLKFILFAQPRPLKFRTYNFSFPYLNISHFLCFVNGRLIWVSYLTITKPSTFHHGGASLENDAAAAITRLRT